MTTEASELIRAFVRGERSWRALEQAGIYIEIRDDGYEIDNPWRLIVEAHLRDVAEGLLAFRPALWDASFGDVISQDAVSVAERLSRQGQGNG